VVPQAVLDQAVRVLDQPPVEGAAQPPEPQVALEQVVLAPGQPLVEEVALLLLQRPLEQPEAMELLARPS
jgi:hypothetical protein